MEHLGQDELLHLIPSGTLAKLMPYKDKLGEVLSQTPDTSHLKYHALDGIGIFRYCDRMNWEIGNEARIAYWHGNIDEEDFIKEPSLKKRLEIDRLVADIPTYDRIERAIRLHDVGRIFEKLGIVDSSEHHLAGLFVALQTDPDPIVCEAVLNHVQDVLPENASIVSRYVRDIDRMIGSGYIGLIRTAIHLGFKDEVFEDKDEDEITRQKIMLTVENPYVKPNEDLAEDFFWNKVYPFFKKQGFDGELLLADVCKVILDRIYGRNYAHRKLDVYERRALKFDNNILVIEPVVDVFTYRLDFKIKNTLKVMIKARGGKYNNWEDKMTFLTNNERKLYESNLFGFF